MILLIMLIGTKLCKLRINLEQHQICELLLMKDIKNGTPL